MDHPLLSETLSSYALLYHYERRLDDALPLYRRAHAIDEKIYGRNHPLLGASLNNIGSLLREQGNYEEAREMLERAVLVMEASVGGDHPDLASVLGSLAQVLMMQEKYDDAQALLERGLAIRQSMGPDAVDVSYSLIDLACLELKRGRVVESIPKLEEALAMSESNLGVDHWRTVQVREALQRAKAALAHSSADVA